MKHIYTVKLEARDYSFEFATSRVLIDLEGWTYAVICQLMNQLRLATSVNQQEVIVAVERHLHEQFRPLRLGRNIFDNLTVTIKQLPVVE